MPIAAETLRIRRNVKIVVGLLLFATFQAAVPFVRAQGMPAEQRDRIHRLASSHNEFKRTVTLTEKGYTAVTETENAGLASELKAHVDYMGKRLKDGLRVRNWDPAFAEYVRQYDNLDHKFEPIDKGIRVTVTGKTPEAIKIAQRHAQIISEFVTRGPDALQESHPVESKAEAKPGDQKPSDSGKCPDCKEPGQKSKSSETAEPGNGNGTPKCKDCCPKGK